MNAFSYVVREITVASRLLAGIHAEVPRGRVGEYFGRYLDQVYAAARTGDVLLDGQNVFVYNAAANGSIACDFCVGAKAPFTAVGAVQPMHSPAGLVATTTHWGDYGAMGAAHSAVVAWCVQQQRPLAGPSWEVYGHWNKDPMQCRTDIYYLLSDDPRAPVAMA